MTEKPKKIPCTKTGCSEPAVHDFKYADRLSRLCAEHSADLIRNLKNITRDHQGEFEMIVDVVGTFPNMPVKQSPKG